MVIILICSLALNVILLLFFMLSWVPVCNGGEIDKKPCGKILFPWVKKYKLPSGKYCCKDCYLRDWNTFASIRNDSASDKSN